MKVIGIGTFGKDPELKSFDSGHSLCSFSLATKRKFKDKNGENATDWITCSAWGKTADTISMYFHKGSRIMIEGELQNNNYTNKDGQMVYSTQVNVSSFEFVDKKSDSQTVPMHEVVTGGESGGGIFMDEDNELPFEL